MSRRHFVELDLFLQFDYPFLKLLDFMIVFL